ncbi:MAG: hypothetical protein IKR69_03775 [Bacteroidales bacterium]|nr:hypothetical protein [Bacteroidales bacterium]
MSNYKTRKEFIERTKSILAHCENTEYEKTAFLNCCMGLLVAPEQWEKNNEPQIQGFVDFDNWGIDICKIINNTPMRGAEHSIENIAYHFRNCLCHFLFDINGSNTEKINKIKIIDRTADRSKETFNMSIDFSDFRKFVLKYAEEKLLLLKS